FTWSVAQRETRERWIRYGKRQFPQRHPASAASCKRALRQLLSTDLLHPAQASAAEAQAVFDGLSYSCAESGALFMAQAHLYGAWVPLTKFLPERAAALRAQRRKPLLALAATEPKAGSDFFGMETRASERKGGWVLNGQKTFVTNAPIADFFLVYARTSIERGSASIACFLVKAGTSGLSTKSLPEQMGLDTASMGEVRLKNVLVPHSHVLGSPRSGLDVFHFTMAWERSLILSPAPGALDRLREAMVALSLKKIRGAKPVPEFPSFQKKLEKISELTALIRSGIGAAAARLDQGSCGISLAAETKVLASENYQEASRLLLQLGGKEAFLRGSAWESNYRDSLASHLYSGPNDLLRSIVEAMK
ncbi:MAG: acyl-CoA dehydrogenase family protein, partial [Bdellovibrionota bacterium]